MSRHGSERPTITRQNTRWQGRQGRNRLLLIGFAFLAFMGILLPGIFNYLLGGDSTQVVVTMQQGVTDADRATLKRECGGLPGVEVVADKGAQEAQYRFPVRFRIRASADREKAALDACIDRFPQLVRGQEIERDGG